jgi:hypothetical protein
MLDSEEDNTVCVTGIQRRKYSRLACKRPCQKSATFLINVYSLGHLL